MANDTQSGIGRQHTLQAPLGFIRPIGHHHHSGMLRVADAHASAIVDGYPRRARGGVQQRVE